MFVKQMPSYVFISKKQQSCNTNIAKTLTPSKFDEHELSPHMQT